MLSFPGCGERVVHWLHWDSRTYSSSDVIVMLKWRHHVISHLSVFRNFWEPLMRYLKLSKKNNSFIVGGWDIEQTPFGKPRNAKRWSSVQIFPSHPYSHDIFFSVLLHYISLFGNFVTFQMGPDQYSIKLGKLELDRHYKFIKKNM